MDNLDFFVAKVLLKHGLVSRQQLQDCFDELEQRASSGAPVKLVNLLVQKAMLDKEKAQWAVRMAQLEQFRRAEVMYARAAESRGLPTPVVEEALDQQKQQRFQITIGQLLRKNAALTPELDSLIRKEVMERLRTDVLTVDSVLGPAPGPSIAGMVESQGLQVAGYQRMDLIAESVNTAVYKAKRLADSKIVALKFANPACQSTAEKRAEANRIGSIAKKLNHPNIVYTYDVGMAHEFPYVVMEYVEGETVSQQLLKYGPFECREAQEIAMQISRALQYAGDQFKLLHGNIKPDNIIVNRRGMAKLLDYGSLKPSPAEALQGNGIQLGVVNYCSPEKIEAKPLDIRADIYSLGVTLFHMLSGEVPFEAESPEKVIDRVMNKEDELPDLTEFEGIDPRIAEVVEDMTQFSPDFRLQDAAELIDKLSGQNQTMAIMQGDLHPSPMAPRGTAPHMQVPPVQPSRPEVPTIQPQGTQHQRPAPIGSQMQRPPAPMSRPEVPTPMVTSRAEIAAPDNGGGTDPNDPLVGTVMFKRYKFLKMLGEGGMGKVYKTEHTMLRRIRAVKLIQPHLIGSEENLERFKREIMLQSRFQHPNVVQIYDAGNDKEFFYMAMECVEGVELSDILEKEGAIPARRVISIMRQILEALEAAHNNKIIHRDLKTENIMITKDSSGKELVKIMDFGIARLMENKDEVYQTMAGRISGTPQYMSPEQCSGDETDERSDLYSLGIIFYELLMGELPFKASNAMGYIGLQILQPPPPFKELNDKLEIHPEIERVVMKQLEKQKEDRYQSAREILDDLQQNVIPAIESKGKAKGGFWAWLKGLFGGGKKKS